MTDSLEGEDALLARLQEENQLKIQELIPQMQIAGVNFVPPSWERRLLEGLFAGALGADALRDAKIAHELDFQQILANVETQLRQMILPRR